MTLQDYKQASLKAVEPFVELAAKFEQAADLELATLLEMCLEWLRDSPDGFIEQIDGGYQLKCVPADWEDRIRNICKESIPV